MPYELVTPTLQEAIVAMLEGDSALTSIIQVKPTAQGGGPAIYDEGAVALGQLFPYLTIGAWTQVPAHTFSPNGDGYCWNCTVQIKAFSQRVDKPPQVISAVLSVLEPATALLVSGYDSAWIDEANAQPMFKETLAGVVTYQQPVIIRVYAGD
jgi:hypothetical protein